MKNLSVSKKLITGFSIVLLLMLLSGIFSILNLNNIDSQVTMYSKYTVPNAEHVRVMQTSLRSTMHELLEAMIGTQGNVQVKLDSAEEHAKLAIKELDAYKANQRNADRNADIEQIKAIITSGDSVRSEISELILEGTDASHNKAVQLYNNQYGPQLEKAISTLEEFSKTAQSRAVTQKAEAVKVAMLSRIIIIVVAVISILITIFVVIFIRRSILVPIQKIVVANQEAAKGNLNNEIDYESRDEFGQMIKFIGESNAMQSRMMGDIIDKFTRISKGDLKITVDMDYPGDYAVLKETVENTVANLNHTMQTIHVAASQVSAGASQVSGGAQALAAGSTEQASSVEQLTASVEQIAGQAAANTSIVKAATEYVEQAEQGVITGDDYMRNLTAAMAEIETASNEIVNITKAIDDIAFQTNMLSLNAAIEAARAGSAGKGFTVVADEVRNLAGKSAEAAKQTAELIQNTVATISRGTELTGQTAQILKEVGANTKKVTESFVQIEQASFEQSDAIEQIKQGLTQVSSVIQTNAATAEENSATSEEMSAQADTLRAEVGKFRLNEGTQEEYEPIDSMPSEQPESDEPISGDGVDFGKY